MKTNQNGIVSLITAILISIVVLIIIMSATLLMVGELRQSIDNENSVRAYYAAESGAEDAVLNIKTTINAGGSLGGTVALNTCSNNISVDPAQLLSIANKCVSTTLTTPQGKLTKEEPLQFDLAGDPQASKGFNQPLASLEIAWNQDDCTDCDSSPVPFVPANPSLQNNPASWTAPALVEATIVEYPKTDKPGGVNQGNVTIKTLVLSPVSASGPSTATNINWAAPPAPPISVNCYPVPQNDYNCRAIITGLTGGSTKNNYVVRIRPRYTGTTYRLRFYNSSGVQITSIPDQYATIDVTGRAGDVYRRIVEKVKIRSSAFAGLDYVLYSDTQICKDFTVNGSSYTPQTCTGY